MVAFISPIKKLENLMRGPGGSCTLWMSVCVLAPAFREAGAGD